jgi:hypothetical protein
MGEQRIRGANMVALIFLLIGVIMLLATAGRIWIDPTPLDIATIDSAAANSGDEPATFSSISDGKDSKHC